MTVQGEAGPQTYQLQLGKLDPPESVLGAQQRLQSLGFELRARGKVDDETKKAVTAFRAELGLPAGSDLDPDTSKKIDEEYQKRMQGG